RQAVRRQLPLIIICVALGALAAILFTASQTPVYTATSSVQIESRSAEIVSGDSANPAPPSADMQRQLNTQLDVLRSPAMAARVAKDLKLVGDQRFYKAMHVDAAAWNASGDPKGLWDAAAQLLTENIAVTLPKDSRVATIAFSSGDPFISAKVANSYAYNL